MYIRSQQYHTPPAYSGITVPSSPPPDRRNGNAAGRPASDGAEPHEASRLTGDAAGAMSGTLPGPALPALPGAMPREKNSSPFYPVSDSFTAADFADRRKRAPLEAQNAGPPSPRLPAGGDGPAPPPHPAHSPQGERPGFGPPLPNLLGAEDDLLLAALLLLMLREERDGLPDDDMILLLGALLLGR